MVELQRIVAGTRTARRLTLTPLVDVVFILLLFFMLETDFLQPRSVRLVLAGAAEAAATPRAPAVRLVLQAGGSVWIEGERVGRDGLRQRLAERVPAPQRAVVEVGEAVAVQAVIDVIDVLDAAAIDTVSVQRAPRFD